MDMQQVVKRIWKIDIDIEDAERGSCPPPLYNREGPLIHHDPDVSWSFSCIFRRAARIISSRLRCSISCRLSLFAAQPVAGEGSSFSFPLELIRDWRL